MNQANPGTAVAASRPAGEAASEQIQQYLTFVLSGEMFAIGILSIKEILEYSPPTAVPMTPGFMRGVINLRGAVVPVLDLSVRFGKSPSPVTRRTCIVIIEADIADERMDIGIVVDTVNAVLDIPPADIELPPTFGARIRTDFIKGMGKVNGKFVILLDVIRALAMEEALALAEARDSAAAAATG
jgi:purine-binding chemotaxis protein CheW